MNADGTNQTKIFTNGSAAYVCGDSTNGTIVFNSSGDPLGTNPLNPDGFRDFEIFTMNPTGGNVVQVTNNAVLDSGPKWSPDCSTISYNSLDTTSLDVHRINADGTGDVNLTNRPGIFDAFSAWSPDGTGQILADGLPQTADACKDDGWKTFFTPQQFENQGECVSFVNANPNAGK